MRPLLILIIVFVSCNQSNLKMIEIAGKVAFSIPADYNFEKGRSIDTYVGKIKLPSGKIVTVEYGEFSYKPVEMPAVVLHDSLKNVQRKKSPNLFYSQNPHFDEQYGVFFTNFYYYDTINGVKSLIVFPKRMGTGESAAYFEMPGLPPFSIHADSLNEEEQKSLVKIINSVRFVNNPSKSLIE